MTNTAFIFPGQGSQTIGMLAELAASYPEIEQTFDEVSDRLGFDLWQLVQNDANQQLNQTEYTQVAMLTADIAVFNLLKKQGLHQAKIMAGHSLGEYAALVAANAIDLADAAFLVSKRGQLMQQKVPLGLGAMAAVVGLEDEQVEILCEKISNDDEKVSPANYNAIGQVVVAGHLTAVEKLVTQAEEAGARMAKIIPVSVPCHCDLLKPAAEDFAEYLASAPFRLPELSVVSNVDLSIYSSVEQIKFLLKQQLYSPVRWVETIQLMKRNGIEQIVECGPGKVLNGLVKRIERSISCTSVNDVQSLNDLSDVTIAIKEV
ncbi:MAG: ACP S-malonyltransferase [Proteobacteria bacterium]|nr:ACP S-malonyltransferase [Pseudomonadota bacterium]